MAYRQCFNVINQLCFDARCLLDSQSVSSSDEDLAQTPHRRLPRLEVVLVQVPVVLFLFLILILFRPITPPLHYSSAGEKNRRIRGASPRVSCAERALGQAACGYW